MLRKCRVLSASSTFAKVNPSLARRLAVLLALVICVMGVSVAPANAAHPAAVLASASEEPATNDVADGRLVVGLVASTNAADIVAVAEEAGAAETSAVGEDTLVVDTPSGHRDERMERLRRDPRVRYVEPNYRISSSFTPNDPSFSSLVTLRDGQPGGTWAESAWNTTLGSRDIVVGVLDSGIATSHPDLVGNLWTNRVGIGGCAYETHGYDTFTRGCDPQDGYGHGTHVAGIIGAVGNNRMGITGVAPLTALMSLKMLDDEGNGSIASAIAAINWAVTAKGRGVDLRVLSASWGGTQYSQALADAIRRAGDAGLLFIAAAGNSGTNVDQQPTYPCAFELANVVCVAASDQNDELAQFSDYGPVNADLAAPGVRILSTVPPNLVPGCGASLYCPLDGTSMAAPMVSGAAVLALASAPELSVAALRTRILQAVDPVPSLAGKVATGGRLDVCKVVPGCRGSTPTPPSRPRKVRVTADDGSATVHWLPPSSNGNGSPITGYAVTGPTGTRTLGPGFRQLTIGGLSDNQNALFSVRALSVVGSSSASQKIARPFAGGYIAIRGGRIRRVHLESRPPPSAAGNTLGWPAGTDQARGIAILPEGTGGYLLDPMGRLHPFGIGGNAPPEGAIGARSWPRQDSTRDVAVLPDGTGGYVLDGTGALYPFSIGDNRPPPNIAGGPLWNGGDLARGMTIAPTGQGGYVVDATGGIRRFAIGGASLPTKPILARWPGSHTARGIALSRRGDAGWVLDPSGGLHPFTVEPGAPAPETLAPLWPGLDVARGIGL